MHGIGNNFEGGILNFLEIQISAKELDVVGLVIMQDNTAGLLSGGKIELFDLAFV